MADWRHLARRVAFWTVPPGFQALARARRSSALWTLSPEDRKVLAQNGLLHNRHLGERCFILATGPSIKAQNLKALRGETCIAVSNFFVHPDYQVIAPRYHCIAPYHPPITEDAWQEWMKELGSATTDCTVFLSLSDRIRTERGGHLANRETRYLGFGASWNSLKEIDLTRVMPGPQSVSIMALMVALYMGFGEIYLLGCDHDWILHIGESRHFYDEQQHVLNRHGYSEWFGSDVESYFHAMIRLWQQYKLLRQLASSRGACICNATEAGLLDVFPRVKYESLFGQASAESISQYQASQRLRHDS